MVEFAIKDCTLAMVATGRRAQTLRELRDILRDIHPGLPILDPDFCLSP